MSKNFIEGSIRFTFDDSWDVEKYDDHPDTKHFVGKVHGRGAVDFVGRRRGFNITYFIEVKDYRGSRIVNKSKFEGELQRTMATKVFDTLGGLLLAGRKQPRNHVWSSAISDCRDCDGGCLRVVLWLEDDALFRLKGPRGKVAASVFTKELQRAMRWLQGAHVLVVNSAYNRGALPGVAAANLPGAAGHSAAASSKGK